MEQLKELIEEIRNVKTIVEKNHQGIFNHISHLEKDMGIIQTEISWLKEMKEDFKILREYIFENRPQKNMESKDDIKTQQDVDWLKRFFWIIATTSIGGLVAGLLNLIIK